MTGCVLEVCATGPLALLQDLGRPGLAHLGVSPSGAADRGAYQLGARLLAQGPLAAIEVTAGGLVLRTHGEVMISLTGAVAPADVDGHSVGYGAPLVLGDGQTLRLGAASAGLRSYVSVRGGVDVPPVLGSRSSDTLSGLGPAPLVVGDRLPVGPAPLDFPNVDQAPTLPPTGGPLVVHATRGPRSDWLADLGQLAARPWLVSSRSNRIGVRLEGATPARDPRRVDAELASEGVVRGSVQAPPSGELVIFLADHPVTGGYPVVAVVDDADLDVLAQAVPGQLVSLLLGRD